MSKSVMCKVMWYGNVIHVGVMIVWWWYVSHVMIMWHSCDSNEVMNSKNRCKSCDGNINVMWKKCRSCDRNDHNNDGMLAG